MGRRGPPPKPQELKRRQGTYRKDRDNTATVVPTIPGAPAMPDDLPAAATRRWAEIVPGLMEAGLLAKTDGGALEAYCRTWALYRELMREAEDAIGAESRRGLLTDARKLHREMI